MTKAIKSESSHEINIRFYNEHAVKLAEQYDSTQFEAVHQAWLPILKKSIRGSKLVCRILDIGAGSGRDAKFLAQLSTDENLIQVFAVEPAYSLAKQGKNNTSKITTKNTLPVTWLNDSLPYLLVTKAVNLKFDLILLSAVWMHIPLGKRSDSINSLKGLLTPNGKLIITLRHQRGSGSSGDERIMYKVSIEELQALCSNNELTVIEHTQLEQDKLGRDQVQWQTVVISHVNNCGSEEQKLFYEQ
ncbi:bifunctional 2-polyprenyl-6-hydroxyphenol methylase/3-demethylubiquinol 3-O-methyltransferase UbiG [Shewanella sp. UCD-KL12]|uniref:class I SAM-dependent methyltransferase n=1 Tax=Shewanella sp. UCD-KL12 TaxID=1917163 RepID=UPI001C4CF768|nr:class I SAM-dependent methyltransferase [Shewanella sp. UCD-KL12]